MLHSSDFGMQFHYRLYTFIVSFSLAQSNCTFCHVSFSFDLYTCQLGQFACFSHCRLKKKRRSFWTNEKTTTNHRYCTKSGFPSNGCHFLAVSSNIASLHFICKINKVLRNFCTNNWQCVMGLCWGWWIKLFSCCAFK